MSLNVEVGDEIYFKPIDEVLRMFPGYKGIPFSMLQSMIKFFEEYATNNIPVTVTDIRSENHFGTVNGKGYSRFHIKGFGYSWCSLLFQSETNIKNITMRRKQQYIIDRIESM